MQEQKQSSYLYASYSPRDLSRIRPILDELGSSGSCVRYAGEHADPTEAGEIAMQIDGADAVICFITESFVASTACRREITFAQSHGKRVIDVYMNEAPLSDGMAMQLVLDEAIHRCDFKSDGDLIRALTSLLGDAGRGSPSTDDDCARSHEKADGARQKKPTVQARLTAKQYNGSMPFAYVCYEKADEPSVAPIIDALSGGGVRVRYSYIDAAVTDKRLRDADCLITFISSSALHGTELARLLSLAESEGKRLLNVYLEDVSLDGGMEMALGLAQAIFKNRFKSTGAFCDALLNAEMLTPYRAIQQKKKEAPAAKKIRTPHRTYKKKRRSLIPTAKRNAIAVRSAALIMLLYAAIGPLTMHLTSSNYPGFWLFLLYNTIPLPMLTLICKAIRGYTDSGEVTTEMFGYGIAGILLALILTPFFVHTTGVVILKILIAIGVNVIPTVISLIILAAGEL